MYIYIYNIYIYIIYIYTIYIYTQYVYIYIIYIYILYIYILYIYIYIVYIYIYIHTLWMNPREGTVPLINFPGQDTCAVCSSGYRVTADGKCENANMLYWCLALGFFPPESWRLGDSQDVFFFF